MTACKSSVSQYIARIVRSVDVSQGTEGDQVSELRKAPTMEQEASRDDLSILRREYDEDCYCAKPPC